MGGGGGSLFLFCCVNIPKIITKLNKYSIKNKKFSSFIFLCSFYFQSDSHKKENYYFFISFNKRSQPSPSLLFKYNNNNIE